MNLPEHGADPSPRDGPPSRLPSSPQMPWIRAYRSDLHDRALQELPLESFKVAINMRYLAEHVSGELPNLRDIAFALRFTLTKVQSHADRLLTSGYLEARDGLLFIADWRQCKSDDDRLNKQNQRLKAQESKDCPSQSPRTESWTNPNHVPAQIEIKKEMEIQTPISLTVDRSHATAGKSDRRKQSKSRIDENAQPTEKDAAAADEFGLQRDAFRNEWRHFRDHHVSRGSLMANWHAAWRTWLTNSRKFDRRPSSPSQGSAPLSPLTEAARQFMQDRNALAHNSLVTDQSDSDTEGNLVSPVASSTGYGADWSDKDLDYEFERAEPGNPVGNGGKDLLH